MSTERLSLAELMARSQNRSDTDPSWRTDYTEPAPELDISECTCLHTCAEDPATACSLSGDWHVHPNRWPGDVMGPCPLHPEAPGDH